MKLANMIMILIILQATIMLYYQLYETEGEEGYLLTSYSDNDTKIWEFVKDPTKWSSSPLLIVLLALGVTGAGFIVVGTFLSTPSDSALFSPIFLLLIGVGSIPILSLYQVITNEVSMFGCTSMPCAPALFFWIFTGGILAIFYVLACVEWWSGRSVG